MVIGCDETLHPGSQNVGRLQLVNGSVSTIDTVPDAEDQIGCRLSKGEVTRCGSIRNGNQPGRSNLVEVVRFARAYDGESTGRRNSIDNFSRGTAGPDDGKAQRSQAQLRGPSRTWRNEQIQVPAIRSTIRRNGCRGVATKIICYDQVIS